MPTIQKSAPGLYQAMSNGIKMTARTEKSTLKPPVSQNPSNSTSLNNHNARSNTYRVAFPMNVDRHNYGPKDNKSTDLSFRADLFPTSVIQEASEKTEKPVQEDFEIDNSQTEIRSIKDFMDQQFEN